VRGGGGGDRRNRGLQVLALRGRSRNHGIAGRGLRKNYYYYSYYHHHHHHDGLTGIGRGRCSEPDLNGWMLHRRPQGLLIALGAWTWRRRRKEEREGTI